ncbi:biliverdin-producing heme oxygenase [Sphingomonas sp. CFBP 13720]|uniref:biliverdin-producing heme oxygenase n=1 Tax=Sphingomonas sp. CFBP 13720 TaxID=2775302 RepID=UPI001781BBEF|nr:biliverdin-producing heme oxygenase [Sphingomonas sp. CFBP 13720]MBD8677082.1 biliverdin-producing heme oxygenase [Sphingomonas sp. CFBP 13720]
MSASATLRAATGPAHAAIDAAYGRFDLTDRDGYAQFLLAHARVVPPVERMLNDAPGLPAFGARTPALAADLTALGMMMPDPLPVPVERDPAALWGIFYVVEGSRLGGVMLARDVAPGLPHAYLSAGHGRGGWREVRAAIDAAARDEAWMARAVAAAERCFGWYGRAAG